MTEPLRFMDGLDAGLEIQAWLERLASRLKEHWGASDIPMWEVEYARHEQSDGKTVLVWWQRKLIGTAVCVRDVMNFTVLTLWEAGSLPRAEVDPDGVSAW